MRNIFDQYSQPENKLTHALAICLDEDRNLLEKFLDRYFGIKISSKDNLTILEQTLPEYEAQELENESDSSGLPDAIIYNQNQDWIVVIENKISCQITQDQLERHYKTIKRFGFKKIYCMTTTISSFDFLKTDWVQEYWTNIYKWLKSLGDRSKWIGYLTNYMEVLEMKLVEEEYLQEGTITTFHGIPFDKNNPYNYLEAKRTIKLLFEELYKEVEIQELCELSSISNKPIGKKGFVWDYIPITDIPLGKKFTDFPHIAVSIRDKFLTVCTVVPSNTKSKYLNKFKKVSFEDFTNTIHTVAKNFEAQYEDSKGIFPIIELVQKNYFMRKPDGHSANLTFDIRTFFNTIKNEENSDIKEQPEWLKMVYEVYKNKNSHLQLAIGIKFDYEKCKRIHTLEAKDLIKKSILCSEDLISYLLN